MFLINQGPARQYLSQELHLHYYYLDFSLGPMPENYIICRPFGLLWQNCCPQERARAEPVSESIDPGQSYPLLPHELESPFDLA